MGHFPNFRGQCVQKRLLEAIQVEGFKTLFEQQNACVLVFNALSISYIRDLKYPVSSESGRRCCAADRILSLPPVFLRKETKSPKYRFRVSFHLS